MAARVIFSGKSGAPFFSYLTTDAPGIGAFFGSGNIAERKKVVKRAKRDRREKWRKGDEERRRRRNLIARGYSRISCPEVKLTSL